MMARAIPPALLLGTLALGTSGASGAEDPLAKAQARGTLRLSDSFAAAAASNERVARAQEDLNQARAFRKNAISQVLPQLTLVDNYYRQNPVTVSSGGAGGVVTVSDTRNELRVDLSQPIFHGLRDRYFLLSSEKSIEASRYGVEEARRLLYSDVAEAFYTVLEHQGQVEALERILKMERERAEEIEAWHEAGLARKTEVLLVKSQLEQDEANLVRIGNLVSSAKHQLSFWITAPVELPLEDDLLLPDTPVPTGGSEGEAEALASMQREARLSRSDLKQREKEVEAARYQIGFARGEFLPALDLDASAYLDRQNYSTFAQETDWSATLMFSMPLFEGGRIRANIATAKSKLRQAELTRDELARLVDLQVKNAFLTLQSDLATLATFQASVDAADENSRLILEEYRQGLATNLEVVTGQNQLLTALLNREHQKNQVRIDWIVLKLTQGLVPEGTPPDLWVAPIPNSPEQDNS